MQPQEEYTQMLLRYLFIAQHCSSMKLIYFNPIYRDSFRQSKKHVYFTNPPLNPNNTFCKMNSLRYSNIRLTFHCLAFHREILSPAMCNLHTRIDGLHKNLIFVLFTNIRKEFKVLFNFTTIESTNLREQLFAVCKYVHCCTSFHF